MFNQIKAHAVSHFLLRPFTINIAQNLLFHLGQLIARSNSSHSHSAKVFLCHRTWLVLQFVYITNVCLCLTVHSSALFVSWALRLVCFICVGELSTLKKELLYLAMWLGLFSELLCFFWFTITNIIVFIMSVSTYHFSHLFCNKLFVFWIIVIQVIYRLIFQVLTKCLFLQTRWVSH